MCIRDSDNTAATAGDDLFFYSGTIFTLPNAKDMSGDRILSSDNMEITGWYHDGWNKWNAAQGSYEQIGCWTAETADEYIPVEKDSHAISLKAAHPLMYTLTYDVTGDLPEGYTAPANPVCQGGSVYFGCAVNGNAPQKIEMIPDGYRSGEPSCAEWAKMVVDQIRVVRVQVTLQSGENEIGIYAGTPGFLLEKLTFVRKGKHLPESGLGLPERRRTNR